LPGSGRNACGRPGRPQSGAALFIVLVLAVAAGALFLISRLDASRLRLDRDARDEAALAMAVEALIGRAVADANRPGSLPCPDTDDDGVVNTVGGNCTVSYVGRLPWKTLGLPDLRDGSGERLWYVLSPSFRDNDAVQPLNSRSPEPWSDGLSLDGNGGLVAMVFAPGAPLVGQDRSGANANNPVHYLEAANADGDASYASGPIGESFNDRAAAITRRTLMAAVEKRIAGEARGFLRAFYAASSATPLLRYFPYSALLGTNSPSPLNRRGLLPVSCRCTAAPPDLSCACAGAADFVVSPGDNFQFTAASGTCSAAALPDRCTCAAGGGTCLGRHVDPNAAASVRSAISLDAVQLSAVAGGNFTAAPAIPDWFLDNQWERLTYVAIAAGCSAAATGCSSGTFLTAGNLSDLAAVVIAAGAPLASTEAAGSPQIGFPSASVADYLDSIENTNDDDTFSAPGKMRGATYNDSVTVIPRSSL
jgi:hypothetical protein